jgi:uncharacterized membrane protein YfcA
MDLIVIAAVAILAGIVSAVIAIVRKKAIWKILRWGLSGIVVGSVLGYLVAPFVISFL